MEILNVAKLHKISIHTSYVTHKHIYVYTQPLSLSHTHTSLVSVSLTHTGTHEYIHACADTIYECNLEWGLTTLFYLVYTKI